MAKAYRSGVPNDVARLRAVRFTVTNETGENMTLADARIKDLTGSDTVTARFLFGEYFDFRPTHKLWIYGNHKPEIRGTDKGIWDRVKLIPFTIEIPEVDRDAALQDKLADELPGILAWAVRGCLLWQKVGIAAPELVHEATNTYRDEQDVMAQFLKDCCETGNTYEVSSGTLYQVYHAWRKEMGIRADSLTKFGNDLRKRGFDGDHTRKGNLRKGLQLNAYGRSLVPPPPPHWTDNH